MNSRYIVVEGKYSLQDDELLSLDNARLSRNFGISDEAVNWNGSVFHFSKTLK